MDELQKLLREARECRDDARDRLDESRAGLREALERKKEAQESLRKAETALFGALTANLYLSWRGWSLAKALRNGDDEQGLRSSLSLSKAGLSVKAEFLYALSTKWHLRSEFKKAINGNGLTRNVKTDPAIGLEVLIALRNYAESDPAKFEDTIKDAKKRAGLIPA